MLLVASQFFPPLNPGLLIANLFKICWMCVASVYPKPHINLQCFCPSPVNHLAFALKNLFDENGPLLQPAELAQGWIREVVLKQELSCVCSWAMIGQLVLGVIFQSTNGCLLRTKEVFHTWPNATGDGAQFEIVGETAIPWVSNSCDAQEAPLALGCIVLWFDSSAMNST